MTITVLPHAPGGPVWLVRRAGDRGAELESRGWSAPRKQDYSRRHPATAAAVADLAGFLDDAAKAFLGRLVDASGPVPSTQIANTIASSAPVASTSWAPDAAPVATVPDAGHGRLDESTPATALQITSRSNAATSTIQAPQPEPAPEETIAVASSDIQALAVEADPSTKPVAASSAVAAKTPTPAVTAAISTEIPAIPSDAPDAAGSAGPPSAAEATAPAAVSARRPSTSCLLPTRPPHR